MAGGLAPSGGSGFHGGAKRFILRQHGGEGSRVKLKKIRETRGHHRGVTGLAIEQGQLPEEIPRAQEHGAFLRQNPEGTA